MASIQFFQLVIFRCCFFIGTSFNYNGFHLFIDLFLKIPLSGVVHRNHQSEQMPSRSVGAPLYRPTLPARNRVQSSSVFGIETVRAKSTNRPTFQPQQLLSPLQLWPSNPTLRRATTRRRALRRSLPSLNDCAVVAAEVDLEMHPLLLLKG